MAEIVLAAKKREISNKGANKELRKNGIIPCNYYVKGSDPISFSADEIALNSIVFTSEAHLINIAFDKEEPIRTIIKDVQFDPVSDRIVHIDFQGVTAGQKLEIQIPVSFIGSAIGVKEGGILQESLHKLDIECFPRHIPEHFEIDVENLNVGDSIYIRDLEFENVTILNHEDSIVVSVVVPRIHEEEEIEEEEGVEEEGAAEPEVISKGKSEEDSEE
ncbi:MAG: 50S ribosomal protein L25 [Bacteroidota bacterium]